MLRRFPAQTAHSRLAPRAPRATRAFTLLELLAVMAIIIILAALIVPSVTSINGGQNLENAGKIVSDQLNLARQQAITQNRVIEFRLYKFKDQQDGSSSAEIRAMQAFAVQADGTKQPVSKIIYLSPGSLVSEQAQMTSLVSLTETTPSASDPLISRANGSYTYRSFNFSPNGSTDLTYTQKQFLTVRRRTDVGNPPKNYYTVLIEPTTGRIQTFRP